MRKCSFFFGSEIGSGGNATDTNLSLPVPREGVDAGERFATEETRRQRSQSCHKARIRNSPRTWVRLRPGMRSQVSFEIVMTNKSRIAILLAAHEWLVFEMRLDVTVYGAFARENATAIVERALISLDAQDGIHLVRDHDRGVALIQMTLVEHLWLGKQKCLL